MSEHLTFTPRCRHADSSRNGTPSTTEHQRLDEQHAAALAAMHDRLLHAPVTAPSRILDVGCGTGATTVALARQFPAASAVGLDLSPVPALSPGSAAAAAANARAVEGDFLDPAFARHPDVRDGSFGLVFSRFLVMGVNDWDGFYRRAFAVLAPGGWVETQDVDQVWYDAAGKRCSDGWPWLRAMTEAGRRRGLDMECASNAARRMEEVGFADVRTERFVVPLGEWGEHPEGDAVGRFARKTLRPSLQGALGKMLREDGVEEETVRELRDGLLGDEVWDKGIHRYLTVTCGRKP